LHGLRRPNDGRKHRLWILVAWEPELAHAGAVVDDQRLGCIADLESELTVCLPFKKGLPKDNGTCLRGYFR
jgi:hypothetical protein